MVRQEPGNRRKGYMVMSVRRTLTLDKSWYSEIKRLQLCQYTRIFIYFPVISYTTPEYS